MNNHFTVKQLQQALIKVNQYELSKLPQEDEINHVFSAGFERKMQTLIDEFSWNRKPVFTLKKRFAVALVAVFIAVAGISVAYAAREKIYQFFVEIFEKYSEIRWGGNAENIDGLAQKSESNDFAAAVPTYIPAGFELIYENRLGRIRLEYMGENGYLTYEQLRTDESVFHINTENVEIERFQRNGHEAVYYSNQGLQHLLWHDELYTYSIIATLDKDILFEIADSVESE